MSCPSRHRPERYPRYHSTMFWYSKHILELINIKSKLIGTISKYKIMPDITFEYDFFFNSNSVTFPLLLAPGFLCHCWCSGVSPQGSRVPYGSFGAWGLDLDSPMGCLILLRHVNHCFTPIGIKLFFYKNI